MLADSTSMNDTLRADDDTDLGFTDMFREITDEDLDAVLTSQDNLVAAEISPKEGKEQVF